MSKLSILNFRSPLVLVTLLRDTQLPVGGLVIDIVRSPLSSIYIANQASSTMSSPLLFNYIRTSVQNFVFSFYSLQRSTGVQLNYARTQQAPRDLRRSAEQQKGLKSSTHPTNIRQLGQVRSDKVRLGCVRLCKVRKVSSSNIAVANESMQNF